MHEHDPPEKRAEIDVAAYVASFIGLSVPIIGAGIALTEGVSARAALLGLAILIAAGIAVSAIKLLGGAHRAKPAGRPRQAQLNCTQHRMAR